MRCDIQPFRLALLILATSPSAATAEWDGVSFPESGNGGWVVVRPVATALDCGSRPTAEVIMLADIRTASLYTIDPVSGLTVIAGSYRLDEDLVRRTISGIPEPSITAGAVLLAGLAVGNHFRRGDGRRSG